MAMKLEKRVNSHGPLRINSGCCGFTLLELLAVMAIVAILAAFLSAALNSTKARANQITCLSNLRQLQIGWFLYTDENDERLPLNKTIDSPNEFIFGRRNSTDSWVTGNPKEDTGPANIVKGTLFPYIRSIPVYRCPADLSKVIGQKNNLRTRSYSMSAYMNGDAEGVDPRVKSFASDILAPSPDKVFVMIEEHEASIWSGAFTVIPKGKFALASASWTSTPSGRHGQGCNLSFADGHMEYWKWLAPKRSNLNNRSTLNKNELLDLRRLQESVPKP